MERTNRDQLLENIPGPVRCGDRLPDSPALAFAVVGYGKGNKLAGEQSACVKESRESALHSFPGLLTLALENIT